MCDRHGNYHVPDLSRLQPSRRRFIEAGAAALTLAVASGGTAASAATGLRAPHGTGFCNLNFFLAEAMQLAKEDGLTINFVNTPTFADQVTFLGIGQVDAGVMPYTSFLALYDAGAPVKIVGGGGIEGCVLVAQPGLDTPAKLKGKTLGTFQLDTLEVLPYDWLKKNGVSFNDITVRYMGSTPEAVEAFRAGALDIISTIEPYGTALLNDVKGAVKLSDGTDIYGHGYTDCVLAVRTELIEKNPAAVKALLKGMMKAQAMAEADPQGALNRVVGPYYKTSMANAQAAMAHQPSVVDARNQAQFILDRTDSVAAMGYIKKKPGRDAMDWTLLEQVIAENGELYGKLKRKSA